MDIVVVYKANPESLQTVLGLLRKEGFNPATLEDPSTAAALSGCGKATYLISVAVPREEAAGAVSLLRKWEQAQMPKVKSVVEKLAGPFLCSVMIAAVLAVILLLLGILLEATALLFLVWIVLFVLLANAEKVARKLRGAQR